MDARIWVLGAALLFSTGGTAIKLCALSGPQIAGMRALIAASVLAAVFPAWRPRRSLRPLALAVPYTATLVLFVAANRLTTAANAIFLQMSAPLYVLVLGPRLLREPMQRGDLARIAAIGAGMALFFVAAEPVRATAPDPWLGNLCALASGATWAATLVCLRSTARAAAGPGPDPTGQTVVIGNALACAVCAPLAFPIRAGVVDALILAYLGVFQIGVAYLCLTRGMRELRAFEVSLLLALEPVLSAFLAWGVHGERPTPLALAGSALILIASLSQSWRDAEPSSVV